MPREGGTVRTVANPLCCSSRETLPRLFTVPRGTPSPAEPFCTNTCREGPLVVRTGRPTLTVALPCCGARGTGNRLGGLVSRGTVYHPPPRAPGAHIHP